MAQAAGYPPPPAINTLPPWLPGSGWTLGTSRLSFPTLDGFPRPISVSYDPLRRARQETADCRRFAQTMNHKYSDTINRIVLIFFNPVNLVNPVEFSFQFLQLRQVLECT